MQNLILYFSGSNVALKRLGFAWRYNNYFSTIENLDNQINLEAKFTANCYCQRYIHHQALIMRLKRVTRDVVKLLKIIYF